MEAPRPRPSSAEISLVLLGTSLLVLASPLRVVWAQRSWLAPFAVWLLLVLLAAAAARSAPEDEP
ncbi:hypothetical protein [Polyangium aurulentum]|uniref:hypothetical protein n=1 Tax=Polyangium aurulentum TaxID=2567896 RepID=UPI0010AE3351|nr:hypothetical protein [Polyangium aurulentum]UQA57682.1 hypothetical protein E8A73_041445 [Polyangium aurulentum]